MGGFAFCGSHDDNGPTIGEIPFDIETNPHYTLDIPKFETLIYIMRHFPDIITNVPEDTILDRAESSSLSKALLIIQVAWFCTNCASRLVQHLSLSLLEVSTAARALCTLVIYFVWWSKPLNVAAPTLLLGKKAQEVYALLRCSDPEYNTAMAMAMAGKGGDSGASQGRQVSAKIVLAADALRPLPTTPTTEQLPPEPRFREQQNKLVPGNIPNWSPSEALFRLKVTAICQIAYAPIYFLGWNSNISSPTDQLLWRVSSIVVTCSGLVGWCVLFLCIKLNCLSESRPVSIMVGAIQFIHMIASFALIAESFGQLPFLDSTAYQLPPWTNYWPHIS